VIKTIQEETERTIAGIAQNTKQAELSSQLVSKGGELLQIIIREIEEILVKIQEVSRGTETIGSGSQQLAATTQQQSASVESIASFAEELSVMSENLEKLVKQFKLNLEDGHINKNQA